MWYLLRAWVLGWASELTALVWLAVAFVAAVVEVTLPHFGFAFVGAGAIVAATAAFFGFSPQVQLAAFVVVMTLSLILLRSRLLKGIGGRGVPTRTEPLIGRQGVVTHDIDPTLGTGRINVGGEDWAARGVEAIATGTTVRVVGADGIVLEVSRT
jgi:membrane protein implicated in regulation of membrane protease activity